MMNNGALLSMDEVVAGYARPVVGPISFAVSPGQVLGLCGANGSGKSTLLRAITGMSRVFSGTILRAADLTLCHLWQRPELPHELALRGGELFALLGADDRNPPAAIRPLMQRPLNRISGGQLQLLQAMACLCSPSRLVLMDEPTNNLDSQAVKGLSDVLRELDPARAVLMVSHEKSFLERHCTDLIELNS